ncbi:hypothetical protein SAMN04490357_0185 [Streptomyces misionensis]|uniref:Uncharacterized protein n=1 Tax=Streptomyces misionensis TaxID=67331 RepID=A0A1H4ICJ8_9ACTN|nr:hypothetical protein [Streptomyces misionensis]SEB31625.1 hypothetical protein SAMN04490357_0185 [Streptomyces misionensis]
MTDLFNAQLSNDQQRLLHQIAAPWLAYGEPPLWGHIQHHFDADRIDADKVLASLPRIGSSTPFGAGYGFTVGPRTALAETDVVRLTVASSLVLPEVRMVVGEPFVRVLRHMVKLHTDKQFSPHEITNAQLRSEELAEAMPHLKPAFIHMLPDLLSYEPCISIAGSSRASNENSWWVGINRSILAFRDVSSVEDYIEVTSRIVVEEAAKYTRDYVRDHYVQFGPILPEPEPEPAEHERAPYIDPALLDDLEDAAKQTTWKVHKLLDLARELNANHEAGHPYASAALVRAILDHIPPVFGFREYKQLASQYVFAVRRTDGAHAKKLLDFRDIADDALHRPISPNVPVIQMGDLPEPARLNAILQELVAVLRKSASGT